MIVDILQVTACVALIVAIIYWKLNRSAELRIHKFLLPYILVASALGIALIVPYAMELFIVYYSGENYEMEAVTYRFTGPYRWFFYGKSILPLLPILGVLPQIGSRPVFVAFIGVLAMVPVLFDQVMSLFY